MANPTQLPFKEAIQFYQDKIKLPSAGWTDIWQQQHSKAFVVAGMQSDALLEDIYNAIQDAKQNGGGYADFKERFSQIVDKHGWAIDPNKRGWRSRVIYDTNITQAYNSGRYQQMQAIKYLRPFWQYRHTSIEHPRLQHKSWDGIILSADDAWWDTHFPQNGWGCKCRVDSLTRTEAAKTWTAQGKTGPDQAPEIVWETKTVGSKGSQPREVQVPQGIDAGFGYNVGKAYMEPLTIPPFDGFDKVVKSRLIKEKPITDWPFDLSLPNSTIVSSGIKFAKATPAEVAVISFLNKFGADMAKSTVFSDKTNTPIVISKALFIKGDHKESNNFKWLSEPEKIERLEYINLLADTLKEPDEIWWHWEKDTKDPNGRWRLKRRYLKIFEIEGEKQFAYAIFEWGKNGWEGATTFMSLNTNEEERIKYFNQQRRGRLVFKK